MDFYLVRFHQWFQRFVVFLQYLRHIVFVQVFTVLLLFKSELQTDVLLQTETDSSDRSDVHIRSFFKTFWLYFTDCTFKDRLISNKAVFQNKILTSVSNCDIRKQCFQR